VANVTTSSRRSLMIIASEMPSSITVGSIVSRKRNHVILRPRQRAIIAVKRSRAPALAKRRRVS
jgi:hypothetical protein